MTHIVLHFFLQLVILFSASSVVLAQSPNFGWGINLFTGIGGVLGTLIPIFIALSFLVFVWGLVVFIAQSGDETAVESGKQKMIWGVLALFIITSIWGIIALMQIWTGTGGAIDSSITAPGVPS